MRGTHQVRVSDRRAKYKFELRRNITIVRGSSGTGKTTLFDMIASYTRLKEQSGVQIACDKECIALNAVSDWKRLLRTISDSIIFIDEDFDASDTEDFARTISRTDNYYVLFTRENLHYLPYSVEEIYEIHTSNKMHTFRKMYKQNAQHVYSSNRQVNRSQFDTFVTEDSKAGFSLFDQYFKESDIECISAGANSSIYAILKGNPDRRIFILADGAAFGSEMNRVMKMAEMYPDRITLCLPESFEWMVLASGLIHAQDLAEMMNNPSEFIESSKYFSWERFFTDYLVQNTKNSERAYKKTRLMKFYCIKTNQEKIAAVIGLQE